MFNILYFSFFLRFCTISYSNISKCEAWILVIALPKRSEVRGPLFLISSIEVHVQRVESMPARVHTVITAKSQTLKLEVVRNSLVTVF